MSRLRRWPSSSTRRTVTPQYPLQRIVVFSSSSIGLFSWNLLRTLTCFAVYSPCIILRMQYSKGDDEVEDAFCATKIITRTMARSVFSQIDIFLTCVGPWGVTGGHPSGPCSCQHTMPWGLRVWWFCRGRQPHCLVYEAIFMYDFVRRRAACKAALLPNSMTDPYQCVFPER